MEIFQMILNKAAGVSQNLDKELKLSWEIC